MNAAIEIPDVSERDIDLFLLEELVASPDFLGWFLVQIDHSGTETLSKACRSVKTANGETDLELTLQSDSGELRILIENKVDAPFQPNQPERYADRAKQYTQYGHVHGAATVLVAPEIYFGDASETHGFQAKVTYESLLDWFSVPERESPRTRYKQALIRTAIARGRSGWQLVPHAKVSQFWNSYWHLANQLAPQLAMPYPKKDIPAGSHFIGFEPAALPQQVKLKHKVGYGHVDLQFADMGSRILEMEQTYRGRLPTGTQVEKAGKSAVIRARVTPIDMRDVDFAASEATLVEGIQTAAMLLDWYVKAHDLK